MQIITTIKEKTQVSVPLAGKDNSAKA